MKSPSLPVRIRCSTESRSPNPPALLQPPVALQLPARRPAAEVAVAVAADSTPRAPSACWKQ